MPRRASRLGTRARPASTTVRTPGTVTDDSATLVATIMRGPACRSARSCSAGDWPPWRGNTGTSVIRPSSAQHAVMSRTPGRNTKVEYMFVFSAAIRATPATNSGPHPALPGSGSYRSATGNISAGVDTTGTPNSAANRSASAVADIATTRSSGRNTASSATMPNNKSPSSWRSCTSSMMIAPTPASSGSRNSRRISTFGVTNSTSRPGCASPRIV